MQSDRDMNTDMERPTDERMASRDSMDMERPSEGRDMEADSRGMSADEMAQEGATDLPDREAMSLINANVAAPVNLAAALNVLSDDSTAIAIAEQNAPIDQST